jgi:chromosome segregation ATPase
LEADSGAEVTALRKQLAQVEASSAEALSAYEATLAEREAAVTTLQARIAALEADSGAELLTMQEQLVQVEASSAEALSASEKALSEKEAEVSALHDRISTLKVDADAELATLRDARDCADARVAQAEVGIAARDAELAALREEVAGFAASLDRKDGVYAAVLQSNSTLRAEVDALTVALEMTKSQSRERSGKAVAKIKQLTAELEAAREEVNLARMEGEDRAAQQPSVDQESERIAWEANFEADRRAMSEKSDYLTNKISEMAELEIKLREKVRSLKAQRAEMQAATAQLTRDLEAARDTHAAAAAAHAGELASYDAQVSGLVSQMSALEDELAAAKSRISELAGSLKEREFLVRPAAHFTVLLRCSDGSQNWCLTR